jgi:hypothetical protein
MDDSSGDGILILGAPLSANLLYRRDGEDEEGAV